MKKTLLSLILLAGGMLCANAQMASGVQARVYAYDLQQTSTDKGVEGGTITSYTLTFKTNTAATSANVILKCGDVSYTVAASATDGDTKKSWKAVVDAKELNDLGNSVTAGDYNWSVEVSAGAVESFTTICNTANNGFYPYRTFGLCVDQSPESDYFGRVYLTNQSTGTGRNAVGMYAFTPELIMENDGEPYTTCNLIGKEYTESLTSGTSPADMCISEDGRLFMSVTNDTYRNIYYINPKTFENTPVFKNAKSATDEYNATALFDENNNRLTGIRGAVATYGYGDNTELIVLDALELYVKVWTSPLNHFYIGSDNEWTNGTPNLALGTASARMKYYTDREAGTTINIHINRGLATFETTQNGLWVVQSAYANTSGTGTTYAINDNHPTIFYYSRISGMVEFRDLTYSSNVSPALAANGDLGLVAYTPKGRSNPVVMKYTENEETGEIEIKKTETTYDLASILSTKADALSFDYAGNLYATTSGKERFAIYALPDDMVGENKRTTPAKSTLLVSLTEKDIATGVEGIAADANAPVEYYNLQGVKVENPSNGIFIRKQGSKTTKVVL